MNAPVQNLPSTERRSVLITMATKYSMEPAAFEQTLRATVVPSVTTREEFAAFLVVANEYGLNPLTKEIYAFPKKGGGIQPIVSIDGWCNLINSHPQCDGIEFVDHVDGDKVTAITCRMWRKDREKPIVVTEYLAECQRQTDPWKQYPRRMLRHKALIQCARYAFGFAGIVDPDEAERIGVVSPMRDVSPARRDDGPPPPSAVAKAIEHKQQVPMEQVAAKQVEAELVEAGRDDGQQVTWEDLEIPADLRRAPSPATVPGVSADETQWLRDLEGAFSSCEDMVSFGKKQIEVMRPMKGKVGSEAWTKAQHLAEDSFKRIQAAS